MLGGDQGQVNVGTPDSAVDNTTSDHLTAIIYTPAISPAKHAAQGALLALVFSSETNTASLGQAPGPAPARTDLREEQCAIREKSLQTGHQKFPFAHLSVSATSVQVL